MLSLTAAATAWSQAISVVVPALYRTGSREAHFNWQFQSSGGGAVRSGQFACGSYWIAPAEGDPSVKLIALTGKPGWTDYLSCDSDPLTESHGLLSGANNYGSYNATQNLLANLPQTLTPAAGSCISLVAAMRRNEAATSNGGTKAIVGEVADAYCVVTVMPAPPANGGVDMIRPNITGATKDFLTWEDFDLTRLPTHDFISGKSVADWGNTQIRWRHSTEVLSMGVVEPSGNVKRYSEGGRAFRAHILHHDYASGVAAVYNDDVLALFSSDSLEMKKPALAAMLAYGNDIYNSRYNHGSAYPKAWTCGAGQSPGAFLPPVLVAALAKNDTKANNLRTAAIFNYDLESAKRGPQELRQIKRGQTGVHLWGDGQPFPRNGAQITGDDYRYWSDFRNSWCFDTSVKPCNPSTGKKTSADIYGYHDGPANKPGSSYMGVSAGTVQSLAAAMVLMPEIREVVNTDAPIEYVDRITRHGLWTAPDPVAPISIEDQVGNCNTWYQTHTCTGWGIQWGPNLEDPRFAIENGEGRFTSMHGGDFSLGYTSSRARNNWAAIIALYDGDKFEDNAVPLGVCVRPDIFLLPGESPAAHVWAATTDSQIRYTLDGSTPTEESPLYTGPISLNGSGELRVRAFHSGKEPSAVRAKAYSFPEPPPLGLLIETPTDGPLRVVASGLQPGKSYRIESTTNLADPESWDPAHSFTAESDSQSWTPDLSGMSVCFFRAVTDGTVSPTVQVALSNN